MIDVFNDSSTNPITIYINNYSDIIDQVKISNYYLI